MTRKPNKSQITYISALSERWTLLKNVETNLPFLNGSASPVENAKWKLHSLRVVDVTIKYK